MLRKEIPSVCPHCKQEPVYTKSWTWGYIGLLCWNEKMRAKENKEQLKSCSDCACEEPMQPCEACPNYKRSK